MRTNSPSGLSKPHHVWKLELVARRDRERRRVVRPRRADPAPQPFSIRAGSPDGYRLVESALFLVEPVFMVHNVSGVVVPGQVQCHPVIRDVVKGHFIGQIIRELQPVLEHLIDDVGRQLPFHPHAREKLHVMALDVLAQQVPRILIVIRVIVGLIGFPFML
jgi:hypothetical protein